MTQFKVERTTPREWSGRYARIPGDATALHVHSVNDEWHPVVIWDADDEKAICPMLASKAATELAEAVNAGKAYLGAGAGGSFLINERGQILVPASGPNNFRQAIVGECSGPLIFENSLKGHGTFDLADDSGFKLGDVWDRPYIGIPHNLHTANHIYFWEVDADGGQKVLPPVQDNELIAALRKLRPYGAVKFVAIYGGFILTKVPIGPGPNKRWEPRYVGRINFSKWFPKEN